MTKSKIKAVDKANAKGKAQDGVAKFIAFYLPQFHPFPENDEWWGKGFTEWTNSSKARPLYKGHYQPHMPTDFGFYDLRLRETRRDQIKVAKEYGVHGFAYHYYWFSGKRLMEQPIDDMLQDPESDMPFCLCWANENWTRRWDASEHLVLIEQKYHENDDVEFIKSVIPFFQDKRYITQDGAPVLIVYRPQTLPDPKGSLKKWREYCASIGIPKIHLVCAMVHGNIDYKQYGFDAGVQFPPHDPASHDYKYDIEFFNEHTGYVFDFKDIANIYLNRKYKDEQVYPGVYPSWDNTARVHERSLITLNGTPENYEFWLKKANERALATPGEEKFVFINAWNEWAEGCHLEPDRVYGRGFLEATLRVNNGSSNIADFIHIGVPEESAKIATIAQDVSSIVDDDQGVEDTIANLDDAPIEYHGLEEVAGDIYDDIPDPPPKILPPQPTELALRVRGKIGNALRSFPALRGIIVRLINR